ncbi:unnamed protein product, partial [Coccothraustes coccothraustes]
PDRNHTVSQRSGAGALSRPRRARFPRAPRRGAAGPRERTDGRTDGLTGGRRGGAGRAAGFQGSCHLPAAARSPGAAGRAMRGWRPPARPRCSGRAGTASRGPSPGTWRTWTRCRASCCTGQWPGQGAGGGCPRWLPELGRLRHPGGTAEPRSPGELPFCRGCRKGEEPGLPLCAQQGREGVAVGGEPRRPRASFPPSWRRGGGCA